MDKIHGLLYKSVGDALSTVGESTLRAFEWHLNQEGIEMTPTHVDIKGIELGLRQFFGDAAEVMIETIYDDFVKRAIESEFVDIGEISPDLDKSSSIARAMGRLLRQGAYENPA